MGVTRQGQRLSHPLVASPATLFTRPDPTPEQNERVGEAARRLVQLRDGWLNPPGLDPADFAKRTLTNLHNPAPHLARRLPRRPRRRDVDACKGARDLADEGILGRLPELAVDRALTLT